MRITAVIYLRYVMFAGDGGTLAPNCPETYYQGLTVTNATDVYGGGLTLAAFAYSKAHKRWVYSPTRWAGV